MVDFVSFSVFGFCFKSYLESGETISTSFLDLASILEKNLVTLESECEILRKTFRNVKLKMRCIKDKNRGTSLVVQWLRVHPSNGGARVQSLIEYLGSRMPGDMAKKQNKTKQK